MDKVRLTIYIDRSDKEALQRMADRRETKINPMMAKRIKGIIAEEEALLKRQREAIQVLA